MGNFDITSILKTLPAVIIGLTVHEFAHAWTAFKLGDKTAGEMGRLTFNPLKHIDPLGFLFILLAGFGWAKPVMINPENLKNKHRDEILISVAGPLSNLFMGAVIILIAGGMYRFEYFTGTETGSLMLEVAIITGMINFGLFVFNMIPLPPLDGSHIYLTYLKVKNPAVFDKIYKYGTGVLFLIIIAESQLGVRILPIGPIIRSLTGFFLKLAGFK